VAAAVRWPGVIAAGGKITAPMANIDVLPTLMRIAGIKNHGGKPFDGLDVFDVLTGRKTALDREIYSYIGQSGEDNEQITCITPEWKLVVIGPNVNDATADDSRRQKLMIPSGRSCCSASPTIRTRRTMFRRITRTWSSS